ncbi:MAG: DUF2142 domain-containing protein [Demequinaceae bacterium]|nr:DUF2142 domain-containing protein [Demequinaceae bacterium]
MRFRLIFLAPVLAFIALGSWAVASPVGSSPDDDFHLDSIWCASANNDACLPGTDSTTRVVPLALLKTPCYAFHDEKSAECQVPYLESDLAPDTLTDRGNFQGAYPPVYYSTMSVFAGPGVESSVLIMRVLSIVLFIGLTSLLFALLPLRRRPTLIWGWLITTVPLGLFLIASNNPSGWAVIGVGTAWIALLGYYETSGRTRAALAGLFLISVLMAAGSRGDSAFYVLFAIGVVLFLKYARDRAFFLASILPLAAALVALAFFVLSSQVGSGIHGFSNQVSGEPAPGAEYGRFSVLAHNLLNLPYLLTGVFGGWGLGWLDTAMPSIVLWGSGAAFIAVGFHGLAKMDRRKAVAVSGVVTLLVALPLYVLFKGNDPVGANVQPRYLLPLIVLLGGLLVMESNGRRIQFGRAQTTVLLVALSVSNLVALHTNIRRYVTGSDQQGLNLNANTEWWWSMPLSPMMVWIAGSLAYAGTIWILVREVSSDRTLEPIKA